MLISVWFVNKSTRAQLLVLGICVYHMDWPGSYVNSYNSFYKRLYLSYLNCKDSLSLPGINWFHLKEAVIIVTFCKQYGICPSFLQTVAIWFRLGIKTMAFFTIRRIF